MSTCSLRWLPVVYYGYICSLLCLPIVYVGYLQSTMAIPIAFLQCYLIFYTQLLYYPYLVFIITAYVLLSLHCLLSLPMLYTLSGLYRTVQSAMPKQSSELHAAFYTSLVSFSIIRSILFNRTYSMEFVVSSNMRCNKIRHR